MQVLILPSAGNYSAVVEGNNNVQPTVKDGVLYVAQKPGVTAFALTPSGKVTVYVPATKLRAVVANAPATVLVERGFSSDNFGVAQSSTGKLGVQGLNATVLVVNSTRYV